MGTGAARGVLVLLLSFTVGTCGGKGPGPPCYAASTVETIRNSRSEDGSFFRIAGMRAGQDGTLFILEAGTSSLIAVGPMGHELWRAGRQGAGPREFGNPESLTMASDLLIIWDYGNARLSVWTTAGHHTQVISMDRFHLPASPGWVGAVDTTDVVAVVMPPFRLSASGGHPALAGHIVLSRRDTRHLDTLLRFTFPPTQQTNLRGTRIDVRPPYAAYPVFSILPGLRVAVSNSADYEVRVFTQSGSLERTIVDSEPPAPVSRQHRFVYKLRLEDSSLADAVTFPEHLPAVSQVYGVSNGAVLVETFWWRGGNARWDRWNAEGTLEYSWMLPPDLAYVSEVNGKIYGRVVDSLGVEYVRVFARGDAVQCPGRL